MMKMVPIKSEWMRHGKSCWMNFIVVAGGKKICTKQEAIYVLEHNWCWGLPYW